MGTNKFAIAKLVIASTMVTILSACGGGGSNGGPAGIPLGVALANGYSISVFAKAPMTTQRPDSIIQAGSSVFVAYQNAGEVKDGSVPGITNAVVQYDLSGNLLKTYTVPGHCDGLLVFDSTHLWAMANEDGNPELTIIDLSAGTQTTYQATVNPYGSRRRLRRHATHQWRCLRHRFESLHPGSRADGCIADTESQRHNL